MIWIFNSNAALETNQLKLCVPKHLQGVGGTHEWVWRVSCTVWAHVDQLERNKSYARADASIIRDSSVQVRQYLY